MPTLKEIEEAKKAQVYLEKARTRARILLTCMAYRHDPANPTCPVKDCHPWQVAECRKVQELMGQYIEQWRKEIERRAREKERERDRDSGPGLLVQDR